MSWTSRHESTGGQLTIDWVELHARFRTEHTPRPQPAAPASGPQSDPETITSPKSLSL